MSLVLLASASILAAVHRVPGNIVSCSSDEFPCGNRGSSGECMFFTVATEKALQSYAIAVATVPVVRSYADHRYNRHRQPIPCRSTAAAWHLDFSCVFIEATDSCPILCRSSFTEKRLRSDMS